MYRFPSQMGQVGRAPGGVGGAGGVNTAMVIGYTGWPTGYCQRPAATAASRIFHHALYAILLEDDNT